MGFVYHLWNGCLGGVMHLQVARGGIEHTEDLNKLFSAVPAWKHGLSLAPSSQCRSG